MANTFTAIMKQDGNWWIGWIEEVPGVNCQEKTREELLESLTVTLKEALEFNREEAIRAAAPITLKNLSLYETDRCLLVFGNMVVFFYVKVLGILGGPIQCRIDVRPFPGTMR